MIVLLFSTLLYGQVPEKNIYKTTEGLTIVDSITCKDIIGGFYKSDGLGGYSFRLDSNMTFQKNDFSCMAKFAVDSGSWTIKNSNTVVLKSAKEILYFDVVKFDKFYFFVLPAQRKVFIEDLQTTIKQFKNTKPIAVNDEVYSKNYLIGCYLVKSYFAKEIDDINNIAQAGK
ncbi:MAG: hypothetical protein DI539_21815 [Flavobacterium psychrophilum]|nr:MAG: hypothetical protein DI539_21815 [Flavobacterium psychrophilum]